MLWTAAKAARNAAAELQSGRGLLDAYRCLMQLLDDYRRAHRQDGTLAAAHLFDQVPPETGDVRVDAALAGLAEHLVRTTEVNAFPRLICRCRTSCSTLVRWSESVYGS